jgi:hypothetical protein
MSTTSAARGADRAEPLEIRPIAAEDKETLSQGFERLSERSRYRRFLSPHRHLTPRELRYFTEVDHHDHEALVDRAREEGITKFTGLVLADNEPMLNLLRDLGDVHVAHQEQGCVELTVELPEKGLGHLVHLLRGLAKRELEAFPLRHSAG